jgi:hypothetical protein
LTNEFKIKKIQINKWIQNKKIKPREWGPNLKKIKNKDYGSNDETENKLKFDKIVNDQN